MPVARIGLGSNVGDAAGTIARALDALASVGRVTARSSLYRTKAWGVTEQADFLNAAALLETEFAPHALLQSLKMLELELGRVETFRWGPRVIDLDILAYDDVVLEDPDLTLPHARLRERAFALVPLAEIDAAFAPLLAALPSATSATVQRIPVPMARNQATVDWDEALVRVRSAAEFCSSAGLTRFRIEEDELAIDVRRTVRALPPLVDVLAVDGAAGLNGAQASANGNPAPDERPCSVLRAEFVGIVRFSRPSVTLGAFLGEDRELAYVESLGIRNPVRSGGPGRVAEIFVRDGEPVEYGAALFAIEK